MLLDLRWRHLQSDVLASAKVGTQLQRAVCKFYAGFKGGGSPVWFGDANEDFADTTLKGGDVMPIGKGIVLIGMGERMTRLAVSQVARALFAHNAASRVIGCLMPSNWAAMHLDRVFTFCERHVCTVFRDVVDQIRCYSVYPAESGVEVRADQAPLLDVVRLPLGLDRLDAIENLPICRSDWEADCHWCTEGPGGHGKRKGWNNYHQDGIGN